MKRITQPSKEKTKNSKNASNNILHTLRRGLIILLFIPGSFILQTNLNAQTSGEKNSSAYKTTLSEAEMEVDFTALRNAIEEVHGGLYRFVDKNDLDKILDSYASKINGLKTKYEFIALLSEALAEFRDGHMRLEYDEKTKSEISKALRFPFSIAIEEEKLIVVYNNTPDNESIKPGMEITSVNGNSADEIIATILSKISGDGFIKTGKINRAERSFDSYYWLFIDQSSTFKITARSQNGELVTTTVNGIKKSDRTKNRKSNKVNANILKYSPLPGRQKEIISLNFYNDNKIAELKIRGFGGEDFVSKINSSMKAVSEKKAEVFILDLRGNGGGVDEYGAYLVSQFTDQPFRYFDRIHLISINPSFTTWKQSTYDNLRDGTVSDGGSGYLVTGRLHTGVNEQEPSDTPFLGKLIVLIDGATFSTAADVSAILHNMKRAVFIGEETGGTYSGNTSGLNAKIKLQNSGMSVKVHMYGYWNAVEPKVKGRGTIPDYQIKNRILDLMEGVDEQRNKAIELSKSYLKTN